MQHRVGEALSLLMRRYFHRGIPELDERSSVDILLTRGFNLEEIGQAFALLFSHTGTDAPDQIFDKYLDSPQRILGIMEKFKLDIEAQGLIHIISVSGAISASELDKLISSALSMNKQEVTSQEIVQLCKDAFGDIGHLLFSSELDEPASPVPDRGIYH